jgi:hypothetical protein
MMMMMVVAVSLVVSTTLVGSGLFLLYCYNQRNNIFWLDFNDHQR